MQTEHYVILIGVIIGFALLAFFINKAIKRSRRNAYSAGKSAGIAESSARMNALNEDLASLAFRRTSERKSFLETIELKNHIIQNLQKQFDASTTSTLTEADLQVLIDTAGTLGMAYKTWLPIKGTEPWRTRAAAQLELLNGMAQRILGEIRRSASPANGSVQSALPGEAA